MSNNIHSVEQITLKGFFSVLNKRKIAFIITFLVIFAFGLIYTFIVAPEYGLSSKIRISDRNIYYNKELYKYFPEDADNLWIIPEDKKIDYVVGKLDPISLELKAANILDDVIRNIGNDLTKRKLSKSIDTHIDRGLGIVTITAYAKTPELAYNINKHLINAYINNKKLYLEDSYNSFLKIIDLRIEEVEDELDFLSVKAEENAIDFAIKWYDELDKLNLGELKIDFIDPILAKDMESKYEEYVVLINTRNIMLNNKELFTDRIEILEKPELYNIQDYSNYLRNILLSAVAALVFGIVIAFLVNYFKSSTK